MKSNFVVSAYRDLWLPNARRLFAVDPYIAHVLEREKRLSDYDEVQVAPPSRVTRAEFLRDHEFVDRKFHQYSDLLAQRLDALHGSSHGDRFWKKALALSILRHVSFCYDLFTVCEKYLDPMSHDCRVLGQESYCIPVDFDEHRQIFQNTDLGQEQLFSVYCGLYYPHEFSIWVNGNHSVGPNSEPSPPTIRGLLRRLGPRRAARRIVGLLRNLGTCSPQVGIIACSFSQEHRERLVLESAGRIQTIPLPAMLRSTSAPRWDLRDQLVSDEPGFDRFDKFAFACLKHGMPKCFIEDFRIMYTCLNSHFNRYQNLRWVVCEWWIGQGLSALAMAVLQLQGIKHVYNEHNYLAHPFLGNNLKYIHPLVDEFITLGWENKSIPNLIRGASLFPWTEKEKSGKEHDLLFISSIPNTRVPEVNASYGESGARVVPAYLEMNRRFFKTLDESTLCTMVYRAYPASAARQALAWDQEYVLQEFLNRVKLIDDTDTSARLLMQRSRLTVVNYLSTSYLEALLADVPTIILWNEHAYLLEDRYEGFFDGLVAARICHTDPAEAARFVDQIKKDPESWWLSPTVRRARAAFLETNIGSPSVLVKHLVDHARGPRDTATLQDSK